MSAEILEFPTNRIVRVPAPTDMRDQLAENRKRFLDIVVHENAQNVFMSLMMSGIAVNTPEFQKNFTVVVEFLKSSVYQATSMEHPFQEPMAAFVKSVEAITPKVEFDDTPPDDDPLADTEED